MKFTVPLIMAYAVIAIVTFGHAINNPSLYNASVSPMPEGFCAIAWPLYWSWYIQRTQ